MIWPATWFGLLAGLAFASIPGALLGGLLGRVLDRKLRLHSWPVLLVRLGWHSALGPDELRFVLLGRLAKCNGRVKPAHIRQVQEEMQRLGLSLQERALAEAAFRRGRDAGDAPYRWLVQLRDQRSEAQSLLLSCWRLVDATGGASTAERELILRWGRWLGWSQAELEALTIGLGCSGSGRIPPGSQDYRDALQLLGISADSDAAAVKQAYRRLLSRYHPDKQAGASAEALREATERTRALHSAYALVRERHGGR